MQSNMQYACSRGVGALLPACVCPLSSNGRIGVIEPLHVCYMRYVAMELSIDQLLTSRRACVDQTLLASSTRT